MEDTVVEECPIELTAPVASSSISAASSALALASKGMDEVTVEGRA